MWVWACSTCTDSTVVSPPSPIGPMPVSFRSPNSSRSSAATSGSGLTSSTGRAIASLARCMARSAEPPMPTPTMPGGQGLPPAPTIESSTNRLIAETPSAGTSIFRKLMFSEPDPLGMHFTSRPSQSGTNSQWMWGILWPVLSPVGTAGERVHGVRAQRVLQRGAAGALAQGLLDAGRVQREALAQPHVVDGQAGVLADQVLALVGHRDVGVDRLQDALADLVGLASPWRFGGRRAGPGGCPSATTRRGARRRPRRSAAGLWWCRWPR